MLTEGAAWEARSQLGGRGEGESPPLQKGRTHVNRRGYDLARVLVIDDSPDKHVLNYGNLIAVTPFEGDAADTELVLLAACIDSLASEPNLRAIEKRGWRQRAILPG